MALNGIDFNPTDIWKQKMTKLFHCIDIDGSGTLEREDCEGLANRFKTNGKLEEDVYNKLLEGLLGWWDHIVQGGSEKLDLEQFMHLRYKMLKMENEKDAKGKISSLFDCPKDLF